MFELHVSNSDITNGSISLGWCVSPDTLKLLTEKGIKDPQVVIITAPVGYDSEYKQSRQVVPLKDLLAYVSFRVPHSNRIWAFICEENHKEARDRYLSKSSGTYSTTILYDGECWSASFGKPEMSAEPIDVEVPRECFAPEPAKWEKVWVNHFFSSKAVDQCNFRRRRLFAYAVQPFIMTGNIVLRTVFLLFSILVGLKAMSLQPVLHPLSYSLGEAFDVMDLTQGSYFIRDTKEPDWKTLNFSIAWYLVKRAWTFPFAPIICIPIFFLIRHHIFLPVLGGFLLLIFILAFIIFLISGIARSIIQAFWQWSTSKLESSNTEDAWYLNQEEMKLIICNGKKKILSLSDLPAKKRTLRLRFLDLKSKICRPFSV